MKIAFFINTPAQLHFYKNIIETLETHNHKVIVLVRDYGETLQVANGIKKAFFVYSKAPNDKLGKILSLPKDVYKAYKLLKKFKPDIVTGFGVYDAYTAALLKKPCIVFNDSEPRVNSVTYSIQFKTFIPLIDAIITPASFQDNLGEKQIKVRSYKELAYLHPYYFKPNADILDELNVKENEDFVLLRFNAFDAVHDAGIKGFSLNEKMQLIKALEQYAKIFVVSENNLTSDFDKYILKIPKYKIHDALYFAKLLVSDTQTMTTEAAILGTPAVRCNTFVGPNDMGNFIDLENTYGMIFNYDNASEAISKAVELIKQPDLKMKWRDKRVVLLKEKINITEFMVWFFENYPQSLNEMKNNPNYQNIFLEISA